MKASINKRYLLTAFIVINTVIFLLLSALHFYWAMGGTLWYEEVLPTNSKGTSRLNPSTAASLIIAIGLLLLAFITAGNQGVFDTCTKRKYFQYGALAIAIIFSLRAIGDFKFIGFFKTVKTTKFGINDTLIFSPLCLIIALLSLFIFMFRRSTLPMLLKR